MCFSRRLAGIALTALAANTLWAAPGTITTSVSASGPINVGDQIFVTNRISGYTDPTEIDGFNFLVTYNTNLFLILSNSFDLGPPADPQWLSLPNQETIADGYNLVSFNDDSTPGLVTISMTDLGYSSTERGTVANSGFLVSFGLQAIAKGTGNIIPRAFYDGSVLFDSSLLPAGVPSFSGATVIVSNTGPALAIALSNPNALISWPTPSTGFLLEYATNLNPIVLWQSVTNPVVVTNAQNQVTVPLLGTRFYRLRCPF